MIKLNKSASGTRLCTTSPKKRFATLNFWCEFPGVFSHFLSSVVFLVPMYSSASVCFCIVSTSVCVWLQHFQEKMKLSEQLRMAESERKTQEDKVLYTEQHT